MSPVPGNWRASYSLEGINWDDMGGPSDAGDYFGQWDVPDGFPFVRGAYRVGGVWSEWSVPSSFSLGPEFAFDPATGLGSWTWSGVAPVSWSIQQSNDGGATWTELDETDGATHSYDLSGESGLFYIVGLDVAANRVTAASNVLTL